MLVENLTYSGSVLFLNLHHRISNRQWSTRWLSINSNYSCTNRFWYSIFIQLFLRMLKTNRRQHWKTNSSTVFFNLSDSLLSLFIVDDQKNRCWEYHIINLYLLSHLISSLFLHFFGSKFLEFEFYLIFMVIFWLKLIILCQDSEFNLLFYSHSKLLITHYLLNLLNLNL